MMIPYLDLEKEYRSMQQEIDNALLRVAASGDYILGQEVETFERRWGEYCGVAHTVMVSNGTDALSIALEAEQGRPSLECRH